MKKQDEDYISALRKSDITIYEKLSGRLRGLRLPDKVLERVLAKALKGLDVALPPRSRSKLVKSRICEALGYPIPRSFKKVQPRFPGQNFDTYVQKADNLQIWNEDVCADRRYVLVMVSDDDIISHVRVLNGEELALLDKTGTLTRKYQASHIDKTATSKLISSVDTDNLVPVLSAEDIDFAARRPTDEPKTGEIIPIAKLYEVLLGVVGHSFPDAGVGQERVRGGAMHELVCRQMGYPTFSDNGQMPDILDQLIEVKLQLASTVDLGLVLPDDQSDLTNAPKLGGQSIVHADIRFAIFDAQSDGEIVKVTRLTVVSGKEFFTVFRRFEGKIVNSKSQIPLPKSFRVLPSTRNSDKPSPLN